MTLSFEGLPLLIIFLLPGFFVFHTRQYLNPIVDHRLDNFELGLLSLGYGTVISVFEALMFTFALSYIPVNIAKLITDPITQFSNRPVFLIGGIFVWITIGIILSLFVGVYDPYHRLMTKINSRSRRVETDIWHNILEVERLKSGKNTAVTANIHLKNGDLYFGFVREFDNKPDDTGNRSFTLHKVTFVRSNETNPTSVTGYLGDNSFVILNTRDIDSIELFIGN